VLFRRVAVPFVGQGPERTNQPHARLRGADHVVDETPLGRWGTPHDVAKLARFLVSEDAAYLTGQVININGGAVR